MVGSALLLEARRRRALGNYSRKTLGIYQRSWRVSKAPDALLQLCLFRHELGYRVPSDLGLELSRTTAAMSSRDREQSALLSCITRRESHLSAQSLFADWLCSSSCRGISVVGNSAALAGKGLALQIDSSDCVIRFNDWQGAVEDVGSRTDMWVRSPLHMRYTDFPTPETIPAWIAVTGPEMICRRLEWQQWIDQNVAPLLAVPLPVWRHLVRELEAPPSAGLLTLRWLRATRGCWEGITAYGMGYAGGAYHISNPRHRASRRHRWNKEIRILQRWATEGLKLVKD